MRAACFAAAAVVAVAGCRGDDPPRLARADASRLAALADRIETRLARGDCAAAQANIARLQADALRLVRDGRVPAKLQEPFASGVNDLTTRPFSCSPPPGGTDEVPTIDGDEIAAVPHSSNTARQAQNLAAWLRAYSG